MLLFAKRRMTSSALQAARPTFAAYPTPHRIDCVSAAPSAQWDTPFIGGPKIPPMAQAQAGFLRARTINAEAASAISAPLDPKCSWSYSAAELSRVTPGCTSCIRCVNATSATTQQRATSARINASRCTVKPVLPCPLLVQHVQSWRLRSSRQTAPGQLAHPVHLGSARRAFRASF